MKRLALAALLVLFAPACKSYYRVKDLRTDRVYYTRTIERWKAGAIRFDDAVSGATVTLTTHEFKEVPQKDFESGVASTDGR